MSAHLSYTAKEPTLPRLGPGMTTFGSAPRSHLVYVPLNHPSKHPLLIFYHGAGADATQGLSLLAKQADRHGFLLALPASASRTWDFLRSDFGPDVRATQSLIDLIGERYTLSNLAIGGFSDGASYALSLGLSNTLFSTCLAFSPGFYRAEAPGSDVPRIYITHGDRDRVLDVDRCGRRIATELRAKGTLSIMWKSKEVDTMYPRKELRGPLHFGSGGFRTQRKRRWQGNEA